MSTYTATELVHITGGVLVSGNAKASFSKLSMDSRHLGPVAGLLFVAIKGPRHDGHRYLSDVYKAGVRLFLIEQDVQPGPDATVVLVKHTTRALQLLAAHHRSRFAVPVIGITGSNGKTIVKEWLNTMLADDYNIVRSPRSWNSQVGVPLSVWNMDTAHTLGIFEAGISQAGEMERLAQVIQPTLGIFTSIGTAHMENFLSRKQLIGEKLHLFAHTPVIICPDDADLRQHIAHWVNDKKIIFTPPVERVCTVHDHRSTIALNGAEFTVPFTDQASLQNLITVITCLTEMGYVPAIITERLERLAPLQMRLQLLSGSAQCVVVNDAYSNDLPSLHIALDFLDKHAGSRKKVVILSDFRQSGLSDEELVHELNSLMLNKGVHEVVGIGPWFVRNASRLSGGVSAFDDTTQYLASGKAMTYEHKAILVKGARDFRFERIVALLQEKSHDTVLEINLNALVHNLNHFRSKLLPTTKVMVMVKAFGYGSGSPEVAALLEFNKADYLAVAYTDEGVELRKAGISMPIMVMNPERSSLHSLVRHHLEPEIYSFRSLASFALAAGARDKPYPIHIKLDTGMHRLGFEEKEVEQLAATLQQHPSLRVTSVFTHLAAADEEEHDAFTREQLARFERMTDKLAVLLPHPFMRHALNTGGISRFGFAQYDMVRLGIGLYGVAVSKEDSGQLLHVGTLKTVISQLRDVPAGDSVGYSRRFVAAKPTRIATLPVGYADGLRRALGNGRGHVLIAGVRCPIVGSVCMDMLMADVTGVPCSEGDEAIVFGQDISLDELAALCHTIPYEILTSISQRVKRVYLEE